MVIVPGGCGFCASFKRAAVFANSAMSIRGGFPLRPQILTGLLSEKTGPARIAPPLYADGFSRDLDTWMSELPVCGFCVCLVVFLDNGCSDPPSAFWISGIWKRHILCGSKAAQRDNFSAVVQRASTDVQDRRNLLGLSCFPSVLSQWAKGY